MNCRKVTFTLPDATCPSDRAQKCRFCARKARKWGFRRAKAHKNLDFVLEKPEKRGSEGKKRTKMPILCSETSPMVGLIHSFNKYGRPESLYDLFWSPVWVLYSVLWLPNRWHRDRGYSFRPLMASRSLVSISSASSGLSSRTFFTPSRPWASLLSL